MLDDGVGTSTTTAISPQPVPPRPVEGISFEVARGEVYGLLGPNGAGKTTTIKMVCGLLAPDGGTITIDGGSPQDDLTVRARVGYVPQDIALYPDLTAAENLSFWAASTGCGAGSSPSASPKPSPSPNSRSAETNGSIPSPAG